MDTNEPRPPSVVVAAGLTGLAALTLVGIAIAVVAAAPDALSLGVAAVLVAWAAFCAWGAWGLASGRGWSRGPVVAAGLMHAASCAGFVGSQPCAGVPAALAVVTVVAAVLPSTARYLHLGEPAE